MTSRKKDSVTKCLNANCSGHYATKSVTKSIRHNDQLIVLENVPAEVCDACGDTLIAPATMRRIEEILAQPSRPDRTAPIYKFG